MDGHDVDAVVVVTCVEAFWRVLSQWLTKSWRSEGLSARKSSTASRKLKR